MPKMFVYANREFTLENKVEGGKLVRAVLNDGGLEFPFTSYAKAAEFLSDEYGGSVELALATLQVVELIDEGDASATIEPEKIKKSEKTTPKSVKSEKASSKKSMVSTQKETVEKTFELAGKNVTKKLNTKIVLPQAAPIKTEDVRLDEIYAIHIDIYSAKNRTTRLYSISEGAQFEGKAVLNFPDSVKEVILDNVSLLDVIYAYAEKTGMSFVQADKYIKIKRGLIPETVASEKKEKVNAVDLMSKTAKDPETVTE